MCHWGGGRGEERGEEGGRETVYSTTSLKSDQTIMLRAWVPRASEQVFVVGGEVSTVRRGGEPGEEASPFVMQSTVSGVAFIASN